MPIFLHEELPAYTRLAAEGLTQPATAGGASRARAHDPLRVALVNLMPTTLDTEYQFSRLLALAGPAVELVLVRMACHQAKNAPSGHLERWYLPSAALPAGQAGAIDAIIVTGAPVEHLPFAQVDYWDELTRLLVWVNNSSLPAIYVCWAAQAALWLRFGIAKHDFPAKLSGVFPHVCRNESQTLAGWLPQEFVAPHSRHTGLDEKAVDRAVGLERVAVIADNPAVPEYGRSSSFLLSADAGRSLYISGHPEYEEHTLDAEYRRDRTLNPLAEKPRNYYADPERLVTAGKPWAAMAQNLYAGWINQLIRPEKADSRAWGSRDRPASVRMPKHRQGCSAAGTMFLEQDGQKRIKIGQNHRFVEESQRFKLHRPPSGHGVLITADKNDR